MDISSDKTLHKFLNTIIVFLLLVNSGAYIFWGKNIVFYLNIIVIFYALYNFNFKCFTKNFILIVIFSIAFLWVSIKQEYSFLATLFYTLLPLYLSVDIVKRETVFLKFINNVLPFLLFLSIISYLLVSFKIINIPSFSVPAINELKKHDYVSYVFFLTPNDGLPVFGRFYSFFDEPGVIGTLSAIILFYRSNQMTKKVFLIYIVSGILSLSFFFFGVLIYMMMIGKLNRFLKKNQRSLILIIIFVIFLFALFPNDFIQERILNRFHFTEGAFVGDNRVSSSFKYDFWNYFIYSKDLYLGANDVYGYAVGGASILRDVYLFGLLINVFIVSCYTIFFYKYRKSAFDFAANIILYFLFIYQRPYMFNIFYFLLFTTFIEFSYQNNIKTRLNNSASKNKLFSIKTNC